MLEAEGASQPWYGVEYEKAYEKRVSEGWIGFVFCGMDSDHFGVVSLEVVQPSVVLYLFRVLCVLSRWDVQGDLCPLDCKQTDVAQTAMVKAKPSPDPLHPSRTIHVAVLYTYTPVQFVVLCCPGCRDGRATVMVQMCLAERHPFLCVKTRKPFLKGHNPDCVEVTVDFLTSRETVARTSNSVAAIRKVVQRYVLGPRPLPKSVHNEVTYVFPSNCTQPTYATSQVITLNEA